uniref:Non-compact myelin associated protein n=1 Tax=Salvator merianae TaxID=96440 RepID=A0A8D0B2N1_SALMN
DPNLFKAGRALINSVTCVCFFFLELGSGAIVAAIVVGIIIIFTVVLLLLKMYNRRMRAKRELEPKTAKANVPATLGPDSNSASRTTTVTFVPMDIHMSNRRP